MQILWDRNINDINSFCKILKINVKVCMSDSAEEPDKMQILGPPSIYLYLCICIFSRSVVGYNTGILINMPGDSDMYT